MQHISNQLNKVKTTFEFPVKTDITDIPTDATIQFINAIKEDCGDIKNQCVAVLNTKNGIIPIAISLLKASMIVSILDDIPNALIKSNLANFKVTCDTIVSKKSCFSDCSFDFAVVSPTLTNNSTQITHLQIATKIARVTYTIFRKDLRKVILEKFKNLEVCGSVDIKLPGSSNYHKNMVGAVAFDIIKIPFQK